MSRETFYVTTPIYFPNDKMHIGHAYTTVAADSIARYKKMKGYDVKFLTGLDEHGQKIEQAAALNSVTPQEHVDKIAELTKNLWKLMDIDYDIFIRTTNESHMQAVQKIFKKIYDNGDIYKSFYEGLYCSPCESFFTERQLNDNKCPDCARTIEVVKEEAYFFKLSKYQDRIMKHIEDNPEFIMPISRRNEMVNNFIKPGLEDLCVSRTSFKWGVPVEFDPDHVVYVWIDALSNYITALGYTSTNESDYEKYWPAELHLMAKEIVRFHSIIWPCLLMSLELPLPKQIFGHGWLLMDGGKMSKSKGNVVDPEILVGRYGVDAIRYYLMREGVFGQDIGFNNESLIVRTNSDLANDLGNLLSRTVGMIDKYFGGALPDIQIGNEYDEQIRDLAAKTIRSFEVSMEKLAFNEALIDVWTFIRRVNKYTDETMPWVLAKDESKKAELAGIMYTLAESLRVISILIAPIMPNTPHAIYEQLNIHDDSIKTWESIYEFGKLPRTVKIQKSAIVFPRIDLEKELAELEALTPNKPKVDKAKAYESSSKGIITIDDFAKVLLKVGLVQECEKLEGSDKLLKLKVKVGERVHQIVSGIAKSYAPEDMIGKKVIVVSNLKPVKLRGTLSEGMILAAPTGDKVEVLFFGGELPDGAVVS